MEVKHISQILNEYFMMLKDLTQKERHELLSTPICETYIKSLKAGQKVYARQYLVTVFNKLNPNNKCMFVVDPLCISLSDFQSYIQILLNDDDIMFVYDSVYALFADNLPKSSRFTKGKN